MITNFTSKNIKNFYCKHCHFNCSKRGDYTRHINTAKHRMITNDNNFTSKNIIAFRCDCGKKYKYASGLSRHKLTCTVINEVQEKSIIVDSNATNTIVRSSDKKETIFLELMTKNQELMEMLQEQSKTIQEQNKTIKEMVPKIGNTTNNTFNLNIFLKEQCKEAINFSDFIENIQISSGDLENQGQLGYADGITKILIDNLKQLGLRKRPIHCTDKKRNTLYIKENNEWEKEGSQEYVKKGIQEITRKTQRELIKMKEENEGEYSDVDSDFSNKCMEIQRNLVPVTPRDTTISKIVENLSNSTTITK